MIFSDTDIKELVRSTQINIHNTRSLIHALKYVSHILQTEKAFTVEEYKHTHTHTHTHTNTPTHTHKRTRTRTKALNNTDQYFISSLYLGPLLSKLPPLVKPSGTERERSPNKKYVLS